MFVYRQTLVTPLAVRATENYILGIQLPSPGPDNLNLSFQYDEEGATDRLSYFFSSHSNFFTINEVTYRDNLHIPLVSPLYGKPLTACIIITLGSWGYSYSVVIIGFLISESPPPTVETSLSSPSIDETVLPTQPGSTTEQTAVTTTLKPSPPTISPSQPPFALIVGAAIVGVVVVTLLVLVVILAVKYHRLRLSKMSHLDNPTYHGKVAELEIGREGGRRGV